MMLKNGKHSSEHSSLYRRMKAATMVLSILWMACCGSVSQAQSVAAAELNNNAGKNSRAAIDIGLYSTKCGEFEVRLRPSENIPDASVTNIQFAVKWPENTVNIIHPVSAFEVALQEPVVHYNGFCYAVFVSVTGTAINWYAGEEYVVLAFEHDNSGQGYGDLVIADDDWSQQHNAMYYVEILGIDQTGTIYHNAINTYLGNCEEIDIGLFHTTCARFEVRAYPYDEHTNTYVTNIQFTIKWKANTVDITDVESDFGLEPQWPVTVINDTNYLVFATVDGTAVNWNAEEEYVVMTFGHSENGSGTTDFYIADDEWTAANNGVYFIELLGVDKTGAIYHHAVNVYIGSCEVFVRVWLQGPFNPAAQEMYTTLNSLGLLPLSQPYNKAPWNYGGLETVNALPDSIVDWVLVELRDAADSSLVLEKRAGLLTRSGNVVDTSFTDALRFGSLYANTNYYLAVWHRNHMPVMSADPALLPNEASPYDFTETVITQPFRHNDPYPALKELEPSGSDRWGMIAGNVLPDRMLKYVGLDNDRDPLAALIIQQSGQPWLHNTATGYHREDVDLNGIIKYIGSQNDRDIIIANILNLTGQILLTTSYHSVVPQAVKDETESEGENQTGRNDDRYVEK